MSGQIIIYHLREIAGDFPASATFFLAQVMWGRYFHFMRVDRPYLEDHPNE